MQGLFEVLNENSSAQHNETMLSLQYCKLVKEEKGYDRKVMGHERVKANVCKYKEKMGE